MIDDNEHNANPIVIEEEPSHEIYANLIGKDPSKITSTTTKECHRHDSCSSLPYTAAAAAHICKSQSTIIPPDAQITSRSNTSESTEAKGEDQNGTRNLYDVNVTTRNIHTNNNSFASVYKRALDSMGTSPLSQLSLDKKNKGFQLLTKMGFREIDGGLGKLRQGKLSPIKTALKVDKRGLGSGKQLVQRVTHSQYVASVKQTGKVAQNAEHSFVKESKGQRKQRLKNEVQKEQIQSKRARMLINSDLTEDYGVFLGIK